MCVCIHTHTHTHYTLYISYREHTHVIPNTFHDAMLKTGKGFF